MSENFTDRLLKCIDEKGSPVCVGVDPAFDRLPDALRKGADGPEARLAAIEAFCRQVLEAVAPIVPAVKLQSAYFEVYRSQGVRVYFEMVQLAASLGLVVIGDVKRNDIGSTAAAYAEAHLAGPDCPDAVTVNGYFGADGIEPFLKVAAAQGKGVFVLVRTSNPSAGQLQDFTDAAGKHLYEQAAEQVAALGSRQDLIGRSGYSCLAAVVGATYPAEARRLRQIMTQQIFLVPGYGAQGATAADCAAAFKSDGTGAIVNASRSVIYAFAGQCDWKAAIAQAAKAFAQDIRAALK